MLSTLPWAVSSLCWWLAAGSLAWIVGPGVGGAASALIPSEALSRVIAEAMVAPDALRLLSVLAMPVAPVPSRL